MEKLFEQLSELVDSGGSCVNLGRNILAKYPELYKWVLAKTEFLNPQNPSFNERVWCIINNKSSIVLNDFGKPAKFKNLFNGYSLCSHSQARAEISMKKLAEKEAKLSSKPAKKSEQDKKFEKFKKRNMKRNKDLYESDAIENKDYVQCPVSGARMRFIRRDYIENILAMEYEDYLEQYPNQKMICDSRVETIKKGLHQKDPETGLTYHELSSLKASQSLQTIDTETGLNGYQKKGIKTRNTHISKVDEFGRNGYQRQAIYRTTTLMEDGRTREQHSHEKRIETISKRDGYMKKYSASKISKKVLSPVIDLLNSLNVKYYFDENEYVVRDHEKKRMYLYDLVCPDLKLVVEYQSSVFHPWPKMTEEEWKNWKSLYSNLSADDVKEYEDRKAAIMEQTHGMAVRYVWEKTAKSDVEEILCFLKTQIMKF
jgi:hypothetical protein